MPYIVSLRMQNELIEQYCMKECKKIDATYCIDRVFGKMLVCKEEHCPNIERQLPNFLTFGGESMTLRKLRRE